MTTSLRASQKTKMTPAGELPVDWGCVRFKELVEDAIYGLSRPTAVGGNAPILKMNGIRDGKLCLTDLDTVNCSEAELTQYAIKRGDLLFNRTNSAELVGKAAVSRTDAAVVFASYLVRYRLKSSMVSPDYAGYWFNFSPVQRRLKEIATVGVSQSNINPTRLQHDLHFAMPPLPEQRKIADILTTWDEALEKLDALIAAQERRKKGLMQRLLGGKLRLPGCKGKWNKATLGDVAENVADQNKGRMGTTSLYGVTKADGMVPMREHVKGESFDRCKRVETGWFAYNPMRINIGSIARWRGVEAVMVSGDYVVFRCHADRLLPAYLDQLRQSWMWQTFVTRGGNGSVRIRIYFSDLAEFIFPCPPIDEQRRIATILDTADQHLALLRTQRAALDRQKRGLMQRLLTGKLRVKT